MANRAALRELQHRLASRLQAARGQEHSVSWLAVEAAGERYLFPLTQAEEIFSAASVQPVPYVQSWFVGVANLRGSLFGVVDLARFIGASGGDETRRDINESTAKASLVTLNAALDVNCAILVGRLSGLRGVESFRASHQAPPESPEYFGHLYVDSDGVRWQELNLQLLSQSARFLSIGA
ncbi:MAG: chemotaxis protein CheW [Burkholderiaceae bacterium]